MDEQPDEIIANICQYLELRDNIKLKKMCKRFNKIINSEKISGPKPKNFIDFMFNDKIYYTGAYIDRILRPFNNLTPHPQTNIFDEELSTISSDTKFISTDINILELFHLAKFTFKIDEFFQNKIRHIVSDAEHEHVVNYLLKYFIFLGDNETIEKIIMHVCKPNTIKYCYYRYILIFASIFKKISVVRFLFNKYNQQKYSIYVTILSYNIVENNVDIVNFLLKNLINFDSNQFINKKLYGSTDRKNILVHIYKYKSISNFFKSNLDKLFDTCVERGRASTVKLLLDKNPTFINRITPQILNQSIIHMNHKTVDVLINQGADMSNVEYSLDRLWYFIYFKNVSNSPIKVVLRVYKLCAILLVVAYFLINLIVYLY